ncbi:Carboxylesterase NlhH [Posidoniimonas corsicana]|uniref:Carboxylesterase NlhH n=1 Tax=Posidoniimonas corsicana TaxID=1938618 RepID=A0A5C5VDQ7_9BACT|nr:alpha/beta hydrolase [Posidoniimonas corsicana]TWT36077.1 Carboxylesterase NlhH [Posidoniimonas corsicana]
MTCNPLGHAARRSLGVVVALCLLATEPATAQPPAPTVNDLVYAKTVSDSGEPIELHLDLWMPLDRSARPRPLVIWVHGGAWLAGSYNAPPPGLRQLLRRGFAVASVQYRLSSQAIAPAQIHDIKGAVRFLRANAARRQLDPERFAVWGASAGGHLAALLATSGGVAESEGDVGGNVDQPSGVQAAVDYFGPTDLLRMQTDVADPPGSAIDHDAPDSPESKLLGFTGPGRGVGVLREAADSRLTEFASEIALAKLMNPIEHVDAHDPPIFIAHGEDDNVVPIEQSVRLAQKLAEAGVPHELQRVAGAGHGFRAMSADVNSAAVDFLAERIGPATQKRRQADAGSAE